MNTPTVLHSIFGDNYIYLLLYKQDACVIDPGAAEPVEKLLSRHGLNLKLILNTHHHFDHIGGNRTLKNSFGCPVIGGNRSIPEITRVVQHGDTIPFGPFHSQVIATPGHTRDSLCFYLPNNPGLVFTGDTLFIGGCGRLMEGTASQLWSSLKTLSQLPDNTLVYPGHEYTEDNYNFLVQEEPDNPVIVKRAQTLKERLKAQGCTIPSSIGIEKEANLFIQAPTPKELATLRLRKDKR